MKWRSASEQPLNTKTITKDEKGFNEYTWYGNLAWIDGSQRKWDCQHVNKCDVLIDTPVGMYEYNTDYPEPGFPYRYVFIDELLQFIDVYDVKVRGPFELCNCPKDNE